MEQDGEQQKRSILEHLNPIKTVRAIGNWVLGVIESQEWEIQQTTRSSADHNSTDERNKPISQ